MNQGRWVIEFKDRPEASGNWNRVSEEYFHRMTSGHPVDQISDHQGNALPMHPHPLEECRRALQGLVAEPRPIGWRCELVYRYKNLDDSSVVNFVGN